MNVYSKYVSGKGSNSRKGHFNFTSQRLSESKPLVPETPGGEGGKSLASLVKFQTERKEQKSKTDSANYGFNFTNKINRVIVGSESNLPPSGQKVRALPKKPVISEKTRTRETEAVPFRAGQFLPQNSALPNPPVDESIETPKGGALPKGIFSRPLTFTNNTRFAILSKNGKDSSADNIGKSDITSTHSQANLRPRHPDPNTPNDEYGDLTQFDRKNSLTFNHIARLVLTKNASSGGKPKTASQPRKVWTAQASDESRTKFLTSRQATSPVHRDAPVHFSQPREAASGHRELEVSNRIFAFLREEKFELLIEFLENLRASDPSINWYTVINSKDPVSEKGLVHYALIYQCLDLLHYLIENRADFHMRDKEGVIPLMIVAAEPWGEAADLVVENTHDVNIQDRFGNTALHIAVAKSNLQFIERLLATHNVNVRQTNSDGMKPLDLAEVHLVVRLQSLFRNYEKQRGENPGLSNSKRINQILSRIDGKVGRDALRAPGRRLPGYAKTDNQANSSKDMIQMGRATVGGTKKSVVPMLHLPGIDRSYDDVAVVKEQPESEGSHDHNVEKTRHKPNLCSLDVDILTHSHLLSPKGRVDISINQAIYLNSHHVLANGKIGGVSSQPKYEQRSMIFPQRQDSRGIFLKKKSEKSITTKFGAQFREGRSQARATPSHHKASLPKGFVKRDASRMPIEDTEGELCDRIDIEVLNDKVKKEGVRTFIKQGQSGLKGDPEGTEPLFTQARKPSLNDFIIHSIIGKGSFGEVYLVQKKGTKKFYAMKTLPKKRIIKENLTRYALTERNVLSTINHPFIVKLRYAFQNTKTLFLIMDYLPGGDLGRYLQDEGQISEAKARIYAAEIVLAISELHQRDIIFRDLKPENVLLDKDGHAMLSDFGLSKENVQLENQEKSFCGSVAYLAPEMLKKTGHGKAMDWYLVGVIIYEMVVGIPPFFAETKEELFRNIEHATVRFPSALSSQLKDLLSKLFEKDPLKRIREEQIKSHPWFSEISWEAAMFRKLRPPKPHIKRMKMNQLGDIIPDVESENFGVENLKGWTFIEETTEGEPGAP